MLSCKEKEWVFKTLQNAILADDFNITCEHCDMTINKGVCKNYFCDNIMFKLRIELHNIDNCDNKQNYTLEELQEKRRKYYRENCEWVRHEVRLKKK